MSSVLANSLAVVGACLALAAGHSAFARGSGDGNGPHHSGGHSSQTAPAGHTSKAHAASLGPSSNAGAKSTAGKSGHSSNAGSTHAGGSKAAPGVKRDAHGKIARSAHAKDEFKKGHPCPSTGKGSGACPGYVIDHRVPLKRGGADNPDNMQWQTTATAKAKDKAE
jgi:hypothetical protein